MCQYSSKGGGELDCGGLHHAIDGVWCCPPRPFSAQSIPNPSGEPSPAVLCRIPFVRTGGALFGDGGTTEGLCVSTGSNNEQGDGGMANEGCGCWTICGEVGGEKK
mmetsp:Transcript_24577/g.60756  ORF Transcript_24577/g.60756 Transcript_24577/m.60756 type:complete len:106 (-) Transcript_24577:3413-3730(-)